MKRFQVTETQGLTVCLLGLVLLVALLPFLVGVKADVVILSLSPSSGSVGASIDVEANITTVDGAYRLLFGEIELLGGNAIGTNVTTSFVVPHVPAGVHDITIIDVSAEENNTMPFTVYTSIVFEPRTPESPAQLQQGDNLTIYVNVTGGKESHLYPSPEIRAPAANMTYNASDRILTNDTGDYYGNFTYPDEFSEGANTNFTGFYDMLLNETVHGSFFIGLTNASEYHRGDVVNIRGLDYPVNQTVTVRITLGNETIDSLPFNVTDGAVDLNWSVPQDSLIGDYTLSIRPVPQSKQETNDTQDFLIPGFSMGIVTRNLADEAVPRVFVRVYDRSADLYHNTTSNQTGSASFTLEKGSHDFEAFFKEVKVGELRNITITDETEENITCEITHLNIRVVDPQNVSMPDVSVILVYNYTTNLDERENKSTSEFGTTSITGVVRFRSILPNVTCRLNASRYGEIFNQNNDTIRNLPAEAYVNVTILCPSETLQIDVVDANGEPIAEVGVRVQEYLGGLHYTDTTDENGVAVLDCTFGRYFIRVFSGEVLLNETILDLFRDENISILCRLYGLDISIKVVDYFGQPISGARIVVGREGLPSRSNTTRGDGIAGFPDFIGGSIQVSTYLVDETWPTAESSFYVDSSSIMEVRIQKYVVLLGFLVETGHLATMLVISAAIVLILLVEIRQRRRSISRKE